MAFPNTAELRDLSGMAISQHELVKFGLKAGYVVAVIVLANVVARACNSLH